MNVVSLATWLIDMQNNHTWSCRRDAPAITVEHYIMLDEHEVYPRITPLNHDNSGVDFISNALLIDTIPIIASLKRSTRFRYLLPP